MKSLDEIRAFYKNATVDTNPAGDDAVLTDALRAGQLKTAKRAARAEPSMWRAIMKSRTTRLAVAAVIVAAIMVSLTRFNEPVVKAVEFSEITQAMEGIPWMYASAFADGHSMIGMTEVWIGLDAKVQGGKMPDGTVSFCRFKEHERAEYDPNDNTITLSYAHEDEFLSRVSSPVEMLESMQKILEDQGAEIAAKIGDYQGRKVQVQEIALARTGKGVARYSMRLYIDTQSKLLYAAEATAVDAHGVTVSTAGVAYQYPETGPRDIYDLGVPRGAHIVDNMPPSEFRAVLEQYQQIRKEATNEYIAIITDARDDGVVGMINVDCRSGHKRRRERHFVFHRGEAIREFWPKYREQLGDTFESLFAWTRIHYDDPNGALTVDLHDGEYHCSTSREEQGGWNRREKHYFPVSVNSGFLGDLAWPTIVLTARIVEDNYARQNGLVCIESLSQARVSPSGWASLPSRSLYYLDPSWGYLCRRRVTEERANALWQEDKGWLDGVDPNKVRQDSTTMREITEAFQAPNGHWYPKVVVEWSNESRRDPADQTLEVSAIKRIYLRLYPDFAEGIFDIDELPGQ